MTGNSVQNLMNVYMSRHRPEGWERVSLEEGIRVCAGTGGPIRNVGLIHNPCSRHHDTHIACRRCENA